MRWATVLLLVAGMRQVGMSQSATTPETPAAQFVIATGGASGANTAQPLSRRPEGTKFREKSAAGRDNGDIPRIRVGINEVNVVFR